MVHTPKTPVEHLTFETDFKHGKPPHHSQTISYSYGPPVDYLGGQVRWNTAGSYDAFFNGKCIRQTVGEGGAYAALEALHAA